MSAWVSEYVGIPRVELGRDWSGVDCYGLARLIMAEEHGIELPSYTGDYACGAERVELAQLIQGAARVGPWHRVDDIQPFDWLLFRMQGHASHIGVAIDPGRMLHAHVHRVSVARLDDPSWRSRRVGIWRHAELMT
ncbi:C40 family peptidase [Sagittula salina]|uniref:C40 family peptidase n=1 Tax=Sagittula salina TaxID=2820268 RepID=A0A940S4J6_9RHOB|nr:NlpC/P60 family protein [Sagittula salina]MBP0483935.1 C40 family peptidase [Sagittula salina]